MFVRMNSATGVKDVDRLVELVTDKVLPALQDKKGFRGLTVSGDRDGGDVGILSLWDTMEDLDASESAVAGLREETISLVGGSVTVSKLEQLGGAVGDPPPEVGCSIRIVSTKLDPARVDEMAEMFRTQILPRIKANPGFRGARNMIDRKTGTGNVGTVWSDEASMKAAEQGAKERNEEARRQGVEIGEPHYRKVLFTHLA